MGLSCLVPTESKQAELRLVTARVESGELEGWLFTPVPHWLCSSILHYYWLAEIRNTAAAAAALLASIPSEFLPPPFFLRKKQGDMETERPT
jgi:hypothetical protein